MPRSSHLSSASLASYSPCVTNPSASMVLYAVISSMKRLFFESPAAASEGSCAGCAG